MPESVPLAKASVRAWFWDQPDGNTPWTELQGFVYGTKLEQAELAPGSLEFLRALRDQGGQAAVISHKTEYPAAGPRVSLRAAARAFLDHRGLLRSDETGLSPDRVFFAATREEKVERIARFECHAFVDDLPEVFAEPGFPAGVTKLLFDPSGRTDPAPGVIRCASWSEVRDHLLGGSADAT